jgi:hypothetical protein
MHTFPWPLITADYETSDYPEGLINLNDSEAIKIDSSKEGINIQWQPSVSSNYIKKLLSNGNAVWEIVVSCPSTMTLERTELKPNEEFQKLLSYNDYRRAVHIIVYIKCKDTALKFKPDDISKEIPSIEYNLKKGDIIGKAEIKIIADPKFNSSPGMRSLFKIEPAKNSETDFKYDNFGDTYKIILGKTLYENFEKSWRNNNAIGKKAASGLVILTPLSLIIQDIRKSSEPGTTNAELNLIQLIDELKIDIKNPKLSPIEIALKLLKNSKVLETCFDKISKR